MEKADLIWRGSMKTVYKVPVGQNAYGEPIIDWHVRKRVEECIGTVLPDIDFFFWYLGEPHRAEEFCSGALKLIDVTKE